MADRDSTQPLVEIDKFGYADFYRPGHHRLPGMCQALLNTAPAKTRGEAVRHGYALYTDVTPPDNVQILKCAPIQNPSQENIHVWFCDDGISGAG